MSKLAFGLTMMIIGIGGTFLTLTILIWSINLLKRFFPLDPAQVQPAWPIFSLERIPPHWREKIPVETIRYHWNQRITPLHRAGVEWAQTLPVDRLRAAWMQRLPVERLRSQWNQSAWRVRITSPEGRSAMLASARVRIFGGGPAAVPPAAVPPANENRDQTTQS